jgi:hypothetical protein
MLYRISIEEGGSRRLLHCICTVVIRDGNADANNDNTETAFL